MEGLTQEYCVRVTQSRDRRTAATTRGDSMPHWWVGGGLWVVGTAGNNKAGEGGDTERW